jgi:hypothetical protein
MPSTSWSTPGGQHEIILFVMVRASKINARFGCKLPPMTSACHGFLPAGRGMLPAPAPELFLADFDRSHRPGATGLRTRVLIGPGDPDMANVPGMQQWECCPEEWW